jgi:cytochrome P450
MNAPYRPPAPRALGPNAALFRGILTGDRDLIALIPKQAYRQKVAPMGVSRRKIVVVNDPDLVRRVMTTDFEVFPKNDLMCGALAPMINDGLFVSNGDTWRRQRTLVDGAFTHFRVNHAFTAMAAAVDAAEARLDAHVATGAAFSIDREMTHLTADIIFRTLFSIPLEEADADDFFDAWERFHNSIANIGLVQLILGKPWAEVRQPPAALDAARYVRGRLGALIDARLSGDGPSGDDICADVIAARHPENGEGFDREELIDQIATFFIAGHETTASVLTWAFFILTQHADLPEAMRTEIEKEVGDGPIDFAATKRLTTTRNMFRETLRLYPPLGFIPRVSLRDTELGGVAVPRGAMVMISPWIIHRHELLWDKPNDFDPDRFLPDREKKQPPGAYIPFGLGPRVCAGAAFATMEAVLILSRLIRRYDFRALDPASVRPINHLSTRPARRIDVTASRVPPT